MDSEDSAVRTRLTSPTPALLPSSFRTGEKHSSPVDTAQQQLPELHESPNTALS